MKKFISDMQAIAADFGEYKLPLYASSATYYIAMATVPVLMLMVSLVQFLPVTEEAILIELDMWLPEQVMDVVRNIIGGIYSGGKTALTVSILLTVWSASASMRAIMRGIGSVYSRRRGDGMKNQNMILFYVRSILYMLGFVVILLLSFVIMAQGMAILQLLIRLFPDDIVLINLVPYLRYGRFILVMLILLLEFSLMYRFIPGRKLRLRDQLPGAIFAALAWVLFSVGFSYYLGLSNRFGAYGVIGAVMVAMMWLFYCMLFLLAGAWLNCRLETRREERRAGTSPSEEKAEEKREKTERQRFILGEEFTDDF